jgi:ABC-type transporter Mla MlaB component
VPFAVEQRDDRLTLTLSGVLDIRPVLELSAALGNALEGAASVAVEAGSVEDADTGVLQLLCSVRKTAPALTLMDLSAGFVAAVDRCGLRRELLGAQEGL